MAGVQERDDSKRGTGGHQRFGGATVATDVPLAPLTTLGVGPVVRRLITCATTDQLVATLWELDTTAEGPVLLLGGGSNVLISEQLTELTVVRIATTGVTVDGERLLVAAGVGWDEVVRTALAANLGGLECLSGIPGSAGATPVQNVGAYGVEVADSITRVKLLDRRSEEVQWVPPGALEFGYRTSVLKNTADAVVLEVEFRLDPSGRSAPLRYPELTRALGAQPGQRVEARRVREAVLELRRRKGMVLAEPDPDTRSAGSFFTNPVVPPDVFEKLQSRCATEIPNYRSGPAVKLAAGWLVEQAGFGKGFPGPGAPARLSTKHALALTNRGSATAADIVALARTVRDGVRDAFGITLQPEPMLIGLAI